ncbi:MAG: hypothetical protein VYE40_08830 [Myxococcota bacterium]|nr:hypothetical protein [Myxococcota bacterium]
MRSTRRNTYILSLAGLLAIAALNTGCVEADPSLILEGGIVGELGDADPVACSANCEFALTGGSGVTALSTSGFLDLARLEQYGQYPYRVPGSYTLRVNLTNILGDSTTNDGAGLRNDSNSIKLKEFTIVWKKPDGTIIYEPGEVNSGGSRPAFAYIGSGGGQLSIDVDLLSGVIFPDGMNAETTFLRGGLVNNFGNAINTSPSQVFVEIQAKGETLDGQNVESEIMVYPISVCDGCGVFDRTLSFCCDNPDSPDTSGCPTFGAPPMCFPGD